MKNILVVTAMLLVLSGASFGLTSPQAQANALNCIELVKFAAELSSPTLNNFLLKSKTIIYDKQSGTVYIMDKAAGKIQFKYYDKNKKSITGKTLSEFFNNANKNAASFEVEMSNKLFHTAKLTAVYDSPAKRHENFSITGTLSIVSGKESVSYRFAENVKVAELASGKTVITAGILKSEGAFKDQIVIDFSKNSLKSISDKKSLAGNSFNNDKRSQKIDNLRYSLSR